jgi:hypothetical protein
VSNYRDKWTTEHGADGLRAKFSVYKTSDRDQYIADEMPYELLGKDTYPQEARLGGDGEFIFVLRPESDAAAWLALREYAHEVEHRAPQLAADIRRELERIHKNQEIT